jgi:secreted trypsin-like serine protease
MRGAKTYMYFAWCCLMLFGVDNTIQAANHSLRGHSEQEQSAASAAPPARRNLIIGGSIAKPDDYPYFAHLEGISCGGSLIAPDVVLTAGHVSS